ncbi:MAG TPA: tetratricopeptide repeat protein [Saprospiraceae bacterium]|nr:tetratricopeptide repeat protein [Saprospiraceae bacterium]HNT21933.1 tetratricopeptide repeat protein [Saprospiraceae bacterium]
MAKPGKNKTENHPIRALAPAGDPRFPWSSSTVYTVCFFLSLACYGLTLGHDFVLDDALVITQNQFTQKGIRGIPEILSHDSFTGFFGEDKNLVAGGRYRPLSLVFFAIEHAVSGAPWLHHLINVLLFGLTVMIIFGFLRTALARIYSPDRANWIAGLAALLYAVHPIHTEVVANIKGRDEIQAFLFGLATLWISWKPRPGLLRGSASLVCFTLALFSKENAILWLPAGWLAYIFLDRQDWVTATRKISLFIVPAFLFLSVRALVFRQILDSPLPMEWLNNPFLKITDGQYILCSASEKWGSILYALAYDLKMLVLPYPLTHDYFPNHFPLKKLSDPSVLLSLLIHLGAFVVAWRNRKSMPVLSFSILFIYTSLLLTSNVFFPVGILFSERFLYMASFGFCLGVAGWSYQFIQTVNKPALAIILLLIFVAAALTLSRGRAWKNNLTLFQTDIRVSANSAKINNALAGELLALAASQKDSLGKIKLAAEAEGRLTKALQIHPLYSDAWLQKGNALFYQGRFDESILAYRRTLALYPEHTHAKANLHLALREEGKRQGEKLGRTDLALQYLSQAYSLKPDDFETLRLLGVAHGVNRDNQRAVEFLEKALALQPGNAAVLFNLGTAYFNSGNAPKGREFYEKARLLDSTLFIQ